MDSDIHSSHDLNRPEAKRSGANSPNLQHPDNRPFRSLHLTAPTRKSHIEKHRYECQVCFLLGMNGTCRILPSVEVLFMNQNFAAIILGGIGQVGGAAVAELLAIPECREVVMVTRKPVAARSRVRKSISCAFEEEIADQRNMASQWPLRSAAKRAGRYLGRVRDEYARH